MYKRVYHDAFNNKFHLWDIHDGKTRHRILDHSIECYVPDNNGETSDIYGNKVKRINLQNNFKVKELRSSGIKLCESDIGETTKFIQKNYCEQNLKPDISKWNIAFIDIEVELENEFPDEHLAKYPVNLITVYLSKTKQYYTFANRPYDGTSGSVKNYTYIPDEKILLAKFYEFFKHCNIDIVTGWNVMFDLNYLHYRSINLGLELSLSPLGNTYVDDHKNMFVAGLIILDYLGLFKEFTHTPLESYSLNSVAMHVVKEGKLELEGHINDAYKRDWQKFVQYNINDVALVVKIDDKLKLIELAINFAYQALIPVEKTMSTIAVIEGYILKHLHKNNMVMNDRPNYDKEEFPGAFNYSRSGDWHNVVSFDVESLYPHLIMTYNISPETLLLNDDGSEDIIRTPLEGVYYRRKEGILPAVTKAVFDERKMFKLKQRILEAKHKKMSVERISKSFSVNIELIKKYCEEIEVEQGTIDFYKMGQAVRKRIANSMYGVLGNPYFHFYNIYNAKAVTVAGQALIKYLYTNVDNYFLNKFHIDYKCEKVEGNVVICVDTDSCYICLDEVAKKLKVDVSTSEKLLEWQNELDKKLMKPFFINILNDYADGYKVKQLFNFKREKAITRMMILGKKRYVAEYIYNEGIAYEEPQMTFVGVEVVRSSSPAYCRKYMKETIKQIFKETDSKKIIDKIIEVKEGFYKQPIDQISSPRNINDYGKYSESTDYYIKNGLSFKKGCPIHNRAAICYNYLIKKYNLPLQPVFSGTKIKFIYVNKNNELNSNIVGFIGNWPKEFNEIFRIDFENQFAKSYTNTIQQFFSVLGWGTINLDQCTIDETVQW